MKTKVFISYSRTDVTFVDALHASLIALGYDAFLDHHHIAPGERWKERLDGLILAADAVVFVITDDSLASDFCEWEVERTLALGKRLVPVAHGPRTCTPPPTIAALNYVFSDDPEGGATRPKAITPRALAKIQAALDVDIAWVREHSRLTARAEEWAKAAKAARTEKLLRRGDVEAAKAWMSLRPGPAAPAIPDALVAFIDASETHEQAERERLLTVIGRAFVKPARQSVDDGCIDAALRLTAAAVILSEDTRMTRVPELKPILRDAVLRKRTRFMFTGFSPDVLCAQFSPDNDTFGFADAFGMVTLFDLRTGQRRHALQPHSDCANAIDFSPDGKLIATAGRDASACVIDVNSGEILCKLTGHAKSVNSVAFGTDCTRILTSGYDHTARLWDVKTGQQIEQLVEVNQEEIPKVKFLDGDPIVEAHSIDAVRIWDARSRSFTITLERPVEMHGVRQSWRLNFATKTPFIVSRDNTQICIVPDGDFNLIPRIYQLNADRDYVALEGHSRQIESAAFSRDGRRIVTLSADRTAIIWDTQTGTQLARFADFQEVPLWTNFSPDGRYVVTHTLDGYLYVWDCAPDNEIGSLWGHDSLVSSVRFNPAGTLIATTSMDCTTRLWDAETLANVATVNAGEELWHACFSPDGKKLLTSGSKGHVSLWEVPQFRCLRNFPGHAGHVDCVEFSSDGRRIVTASEDRTARIWDAQTGEVLLTLAGHKSWVRTAYFSPDDFWIVTAGGDRLAIIWDAVTGSIILKLKGHGDVVRSAVFSPDGSLVLTSSDDRTARIWSATTGRELLVLKGHQSELNSAGFDSRQRYVVTSGCDNARLWYLDTGEELMTFPAPAVDARDAAFSPDSNRVAIALGQRDSCSANSLAELWDITRAQAMAISGEQVKLLAAGLHAGNSHRTPAERQDLLMQAAPDNLLDALTKSLSVHDREDIRVRANTLARPLHPQCYVPGKRRISLYSGVAFWRARKNKKSEVTEP